MIELAEAVAAVVREAARIGCEEVGLEQAAGRVLSAPIVAALDAPPFDATAMDGWAIRVPGSEPFPTRHAVLGVLPAGRVWQDEVGPGEALKVMTGAPIPAGADAVVPVEEADEGPEGVDLREVPKRGAHVRRRGEVFASGRTLVEPPARLTPALVALAASAGLRTVVVSRRPVAGLLVTGEEVVSSGPVGPGQIPNSNGPLLRAALERAGAGVIDLGVVQDDEGTLERRITEGVSRHLDLLVTTGGVSAGDYDLVQAVLVRLGAKVVFHKVAIRPAKPVLFARLGPLLVFGLPGNPVSAAVAFDLFVRPALRAMEGLVPTVAPVRAELTAPVRNGGERLAFLPGRLRPRFPTWTVEPIPTKGSHDLLAQALADAYIVVPPRTKLAAGEAVDVYPGGDDSTI